jgi:predicted dehydrogenase
MEKLKVGIVGFGRIGNEHAGWLAQCRSISPSAVFDPTAERRSKAESLGLKTFGSLDALLSSGIEAVLISTPTAMHCEQALAALAAGKHVMIEKPMALDLPQSRQLVEAANNAGKVLSVFHNRRWDLDYLTVKSAVASGQLGQVFNVESRLGQWGSCVGPAAREWRPGWRNEAAFGGGGLYDWGSHFVDQIWRLLLPAKPVRVFAQLRGNVWTRDCDDLARVSIDFDNRCVGLVEINTTTTLPLPRWHLDGTLGSAESPFSLQFDLDQWAKLKLAPASGDQPHLMPRPAAGLTEMQIWERFAAAVRGEGDPAVSAASVLPTMALLDAARQSAASGMAVVMADEIAWIE